MKFGEEFFVTVRNVIPHKSNQLIPILISSVMDEDGGVNTRNNTSNTETAIDA